MPGVLLTTGAKYSTNGTQYTVSIVDKDAVLNLNHSMRLRSELYTVNGDDYNIFDNISTVSKEINIYKNTEVLDFMDNLVLNGEGKYYLEVKEQSTVIFYGRMGFIC